MTKFGFVSWRITWTQRFTISNQMGHSKLSDHPERTVLHLPGLGGSDERHWQSIWTRERAHHVIVHQQDWEKPERGVWLQALSNQFVTPADQTVIVAHSLGCALAVHWLIQHKMSDRIPRFVMLVATADVDDAGRTPESVRSFAPMPTDRLPCPSVVVASTDDPYVSFERTQYFASCWGSMFVSAGDGGHLNAESSLGDWPFGLAILEKEQATHSTDRLS
jgi:predicted alpha/beta hydrolase family esterase